MEHDQRYVSKREYDFQLNQELLQLQLGHLKSSRLQIEKTLTGYFPIVSQFQEGLYHTVPNFLLRYVADFQISPKHAEHVRYS